MTVDLRAPVAPGGPFGIYIHVPFCRHICPYCDFNTYAGLEDLSESYAGAICREIDLWADDFQGRTATSVFFGGGTPSLLSSGLIGRILASCRAAFSLAGDVEVTMESNPNDLSAQYCDRLLDAGVNRLSIGGQTFNHRGLRVLGRRHNANQIHHALSAASMAGFANLNVDMIYGWPGQTLAMWQEDLATITDNQLGSGMPNHVSLYGLIVEPGTPMADAVARGILTPASDDESADFYEAAIDHFQHLGWRHYEIANWAAPAGAPSRHNAIYWRNGDYAGIGAGAHGYSMGRRTMNQPAPRRYIELLGEGRSPVSNVETIDAATEMGETMMLGLRLLDTGVSESSFAARHDVPLLDHFGVQVTRLSSLGLLVVDSGHVQLTARGALLANSVCAEFL